MDSLRKLKSHWDRVAAILLTLAGVVALILGYVGVSNQGLTPEQMPYIVSGGLGGILLVGMGAGLWLSADLRDEWKKLDRIESVLSSGLEQLGLGVTTDNQPTVVPLDSAGRMPRPTQAGGLGHANAVDSDEQTMRLEFSAAQPHPS